MKKKYTHLSICLLLFMLAGFNIQTKGQALIEATFTASQSFELDYSFNGPFDMAISNYYWNFGDGTDTLGNFLDFVSHTYSSPGIYNVCLTIEDTTNTSDTYCKDVQIDSIQDIVNNNLGFDLYTMNDSTVEIVGSLPNDNFVNYFWDYGNGKTSTIETLPIYVHYNKPGKYDITLTLRNSNTGSVMRKVKTITVGTKPCDASFDYTVETIGGNSIKFTNTSLGNLSSHLWDFGDNSYSVLQNPTHLYNPGIYDIQLTVVDTTQNCIDCAKENIRVGDVPCNASFNYFIDSITGTVYFSSNSIGLDNTTTAASSNFYWIFGDGTVSHKPNPVKKFDKPGYYKVLFTTYNSNSSCMGYHVEDIMITRRGSDCEADFYYNAGPGNIVHFGDNSFGENLTYLWNFGDGNKDFTQNPIHVYDEAGIYNVCLLIKNDKGIENITCKKIQVGQLTADKKCKANFIYMVDSANMEVQFINDSKGSNLDYKWSFGDGNSGTEMDPMHIYGTADYYRVELMVEDNANNCKSRKFKLVNVGAPADTLKASFGYAEDGSQLKAQSYPVDFVAISHGDAAKLKWDFDDGSIDTTTDNPTHVYDTPGDYEVCLTISDPNTGSQDEYCEKISVGADVEEIASGGAMSIYPNPSTGITNIDYSLEKNSKVEIAVYSADGRMIKSVVNEIRQAGKHTEVLDAGSLETGIYYIRLIAGDDNYTRKLMLIRQ